MNLKTYLRKTRTTQQAFADALGVSQGLVSQWIKGVTRITGEQAVEIEDKTGGQVTREELRPDLYRRTKSHEART